ncbi:enoyl-CoA hydratase [Actinoalloteichus sp. AHMU CJ021]|uniref:Enoyl-CoA hydratase n=1 Tax=Actinoalloteichus caeruleus DSM 43889 TaxID=1120930 RepID=A0ABT1JEI1_ACTCY|nr:enoyl-CoA hydratase [Actinoalloteichus caeruleus]AUS77109.1 enoyl-CoA hydratase [Actinoalloteichus sp. AHMU CJ021]MCP2330902.1 enoyl-CoA hydratase [Actinoalloteichus caeruleus DSM 43889]
MNDLHTITLERPADRVALITLNRPKAKNALNLQTMREITDLTARLDADPDVGAIIITGSDTVFAAGADIKEMRDLTFSEVHAQDWLAGWTALADVRTPLIAAVAGYALGGGCELAMMCDLLIAADNAKFGQPEITLGVIPGMGGSQRLTRAVGKAKAMDLCLTGRMMDAEEADRSGLVSRVVPTATLREEALTAATRIAGFSAPAVAMAKEVVNQAFETGLAEGLLFERRVFHSTFATEDQKEGMAAFSEKRAPQFRHR